MLEDVRLPSLRRFRLLGLKYNSLDCVSLVQKITAPNCTSFELAINDLPEGYSGLLQAVEPYFASVITSVSRDLPLSLSFTQGFTFAIGRRDKTFKLSGWNPKPDAELGWVVDLLVRYCPNVTDLEIVTPRALSDDGLSNLFVALPAVTQFRSEGGLEAAWNVLGKPAAPEVEGGPAQWLLPGLEKLSVLDQSDKEGERFIAMIQAREAAATDTDSTRSLAEHHPIVLPGLLLARRGSSALNELLCKERPEPDVQIRCMREPTTYSPKENTMGELYEPCAPWADSFALVQITWPTRGLPTEIFTDILLSVLSDIHYDTSINASPALKWLYRYRLSIYHYSHSPGFSIVDSVPALWVFIDSSVPLNIVDIALERSGVSLLSIRFRPNALTTASLFMEKVVPHMGRWKVVKLQDTTWEYLPQMPAPRFQESVFNPDNEMSLALERGTFCEELTSLQSLTLDHARFTSPLPTFGRNLRFLTIHQSPLWDFRITYTEIHRLLLLHSSLVEVELQASHWSQATPDPETLEDVSLPNLRRFSLSGYGYSLAGIRLLQKITAPSCTSFEFDIIKRPERFPDLLRAVEPYFARVVTAVSSNLTLSLHFGLHFALTIGRGDRTFKLRGWIPNTDVEFGWVVDMLIQYRTNVTDLEIVTFSDLPANGLSNLFMALPDVTRFRTEGFKTTWNVLGKPAVPGVERGPVQWLLPTLEKITVLDQSDKEGEHFIAMIQAREAAATDTDSNRSSAGHHPARLKRVEYRGVASLGPDGRLPKLLGNRFVFEFLELPCW
ncbi:hypothetical protein FRC00_002027 [Tulasnella sp. 408]|nr:hypothetical protein FRC00_002027 [Tulasnella sp. 408]